MSISMLMPPGMRRVHTGYVRAGDLVVNLTDGSSQRITDTNWHKFKVIPRLKDTHAVWRQSAQPPISTS